MGVPLLIGLVVLLGWGVVSVVGPDRVGTESPRGQAGDQQAAGNDIRGEAPPARPIPQPPPPEPKPGENPPPNPKPHPLDEKITNSIGMKLVLVPAGKFTMGSSEQERRDVLGLLGEKEMPSRLTAEGPQHEVEITQPFYLGIHEVTQAEYEKVMGTNPSYFDKDNRGGPDHPVENISWDDAVEYCKKLSEMEKEKESGRVYRLPSEAEWEYSCREGGSSKTPFHFGNTFTSDLANFDGDFPYGTTTKGHYLERTTKVGSYKPNALGLFDMHGNVLEWCADWYDENYYSTSPRKDPTGPTTGTRRVMRGGGWYDFGHLCRAARRFSEDPGRRYNFGFRVVCIPPGTP